MRSNFGSNLKSFLRPNLSLSLKFRSSLMYNQCMNFALRVLLTTHFSCQKDCSISNVFYSQRASWGCQNLAVAISSSILRSILKSNSSIRLNLRSNLRSSLSLNLRSNLICNQCIDSELHMSIFLFTTCKLRTLKFGSPILSSNSSSILRSILSTDLSLILSSILWLLIRP